MKFLSFVIPIVFLSVSAHGNAIESSILTQHNIVEPADGRNHPTVTINDGSSNGQDGQATQSMNAENIVVNIYSKPGAAESIVSSASSVASSAASGIRDRINAIASNLPTLPPIRLPPMPTIPTIPPTVKVPVRVAIESQVVTFPPPPKIPTLPPLPKLPPVKVPQKVVVGTMEVARPTLPSLPTIPGLRPVEVVYEDYKPVAAQSAPASEPEPAQPPCAQG